MEPQSNNSVLAAQPLRRERAPAGADLHVHTTHSDGICSPSEVVVAAARVGLAALAITDHDTVSALTIARPEAARWRIELIAGIELTCTFAGRELHVLGYFIDDSNHDLRETLERLSRGRLDRFMAMVAALERSGIVVDVAAIRQTFPLASLGRKHLADYVARTRQVASVRQAFDLYLADGRPACVERSRMEVRDAIGLIRAAGGAGALAHPPHDLSMSSVKELADAGLQALEVDGPGFSTGKRRRLSAWASRFGLIGIAGSDFHTPGRPGRWIGAVVTQQPALDRLRQAARSGAPRCVATKSPTAISPTSVE